MSVMAEKCELYSMPSDSLLAPQFALAALEFRDSTEIHIPLQMSSYSVSQPICEAEMSS